ncbi:MAG: hypothetical protein KC619_17020 [Myxococcales bacterium]|nr:hypothetical protein [Myxococcales bacterium]
MRTRLAFFFAFLALGSGCAFEPFDLGDHTDGDQGHSRWNVSDGMCPGLGSCGLEVPVAAGATVRMAVDLPGRRVAELSPVVVSGDAFLGDVRRRPEDELITFEVTTSSAGVVELAIVDDGGETVDASRFEVRAPVGLDCGRVPENAALGYEMDGLLTTNHRLTLATLSSEESSPQLACLVMDADGAPLLSADLVHWEVEGSPRIVRIQSEAFDFIDDGTADGARIWVNRSAESTPGTTTIDASMGDLVERFEITVE